MNLKFPFNSIRDMAFLIKANSSDKCTLYIKKAMYSHRNTSGCMPDQKDKTLYKAWICLHMKLESVFLNHK